MKKIELLELSNTLLLLRNGDIMLHLFSGNSYIMNVGSHLNLNDYNDDLIYIKDNEFDIVSIYKLDTSSITVLDDLFDSDIKKHHLIWEREVEDEVIYDNEICECCYNEISGDEAEAYGGLCKKCYQNMEMYEDDEE